MPDLEQAARTEWLTALRPAAANEWPPAIRAIETEADNAKRLQALGSILDEIPQEELPDLSTALREGPLRDDLRAVMAQLGAARLMRLLHWLAEIDPPPALPSSLRWSAATTPSAMHCAQRSLPSPGRHCSAASFRPIASLHSTPRAKPLSTEASDVPARDTHSHRPDCQRDAL